MQYFNDCKIDFESGYVRNLQNFKLILKRELTEQPANVPTLPYAECKTESPSEVVHQKINAKISPFHEILELSTSAVSNFDLSTNVVKQDQLLKILKMTTETGSKPGLPVLNGKVPIINLCNVPDHLLRRFFSLFVGGDESVVISRERMLDDLTEFVPYRAIQQPHPNENALSKCSGCEQKLGFFNKAKYVCLLYTSPSPRDATLSRMPSSA